MGYRTSHRHADALSLAIATGAPRAVREWMAAYPHLARHWRPLHEAVVHGRVEIVRLLLDSQADADLAAPPRAPYWGARPLHRAVTANATVPRGPEHERIVELLIERGANPNARGGEFALRPLEAAALSGVRRLIAPLIAHGADLDLHAAAAAGEVELVARRLAAAAHADVPAANGMTALHFAAAVRIEPHDPDALVLRRRYRDVAARLLEAGASTGDTPRGASSGETSRTALAWAIDHSTNPNLVRLLLERGADAQRGDLLLTALMRGATDIAATLVHFGADVDRLGADGDPPLVALAKWGRGSMVEWLLVHHADPNVRTPAGATPLHAAVRRGLPPRTVAALLDRGASREARDARGFTALDLAEERGLRDLIEVLKP
jgi:uncharacterized protein